MNILIPTIIFLALITVAVLLTWCVTEISRLQTRLRQTMARSEANGRVFRQFVYKLGTEAELDNAMNILANQIREDLDAESIGIFIPVVIGIHASEQNSSVVLRGASCTGSFPVLTGTRESVTAQQPGDRSAFRGDSFRRERILPTDDTLLASVARTREPLLLNMDIRQLAQWPLPRHISTIMILPLLSEERFAGLIVAANRQHSTHAFDSEDFRHFKELSSLAALTSTLIMVYAEKEHQERLKHDLALTAQLQQSLLRNMPPTFFDDCRLAAVNTPCNDFSGDFYDFVPLDDDRILLLIADATGKGLPACMLTTRCHAFVHALAERYTTLKQFMHDLNRLVYANTDPAHNLTADVMVIDRRHATAELACAGHPPFLIADADGTFRKIRPAGTALGMWEPEDDDYDTVTIPFVPNTRICVFTDGFSEALNPAGKEFGEPQVEAVWQHLAAQSLSPEDIIGGLVGAIRNYVAEAPQSDDQTALVIARNP